MKLLLSLLVVAIATSGQAQGTVHLTTGQSYTYSFSTVPYVGIGHEANRSFGTWYFADYDRGTSFLLEMFENSVTEAPIASRLANSSARIIVYQLSANRGWQDLQGVMRVSVLSGSVDLREISVEVFYGDFSQYFQMVSVPEPSCLALLGSGVMALCFFSRKRLATIGRKPTPSSTKACTKMKND